MTIMVQVKDEAAAMGHSKADPAKTPGLYLEDISVGDRFSGGALAVTVETSKAFAREFDPQPFHTDAVAAETTFFGGLAASGWHTAAMTMRLLTEFGPHIAGGLIGGSCEVAWPGPTRPGDVLRVECEILTVTPSRSKPDRGTMLMRTETKNQHGEVRQVLTAKLVVPRRK
jgi:acyl dehydratase